ncbi:MAG: cupin domain-containing protein [Bacteroidota bacterium]
MAVFIDSNTKPEVIKTGVERKRAHLNNLMTAIVDFTDGPMDEPEPPHSHPHEQISYIAEGELHVFIGEEKHHLKAGDIFLVPSNVKHTIQTLTKRVRIIDSFSPIREDFL